jgi:hypothetical protein
VRLGARLRSPHSAQSDSQTVSDWSNRSVALLPHRSVERDCARDTELTRSSVANASVSVKKRLKVLTRTPDARHESITYHDTRVARPPAAGRAAAGHLSGTGIVT